MESYKQHIDTVVKQLKSNINASSLMPVDWLFPLTAGGFCLIIYEYRKKRKNKRDINGYD